MGRGKSDHGYNVAGILTPPNLYSILQVFFAALGYDRRTDRTDPHGPAGLQPVIVCPGGILFFLQRNLGGTFSFEPATIFNSGRHGPFFPSPPVYDLGYSLIFETVYDIQLIHLSGH